MAKVSLNKITPIKKVDDITIDINGEKVIVKQYLPVDEKVALVERVLNASIDETNYFSNAKLKVYSKIEILKAYTNINFTDKQLEEIPKLYDLLEINNIFDTIINNIPVKEYENIINMINDDADRLSKHLNSFVGMMKTISTEEFKSSTDIDDMIHNLQEIANNSTLQQVVEKIGVVNS